MQRSVKRDATCVSIFLCTFLISGAAFALPTNVRIIPPNAARFLAGQKFDLRVEGRGAGPFSASLAIDGEPLEFTSGAQGTNQTDGISSPGYGGFNLRGYANEVAGVHTLSATFSDANDTVSIVTTFEIVELRGDHPPAKNIIILLGDGMGVAHRTAARLVKYGVSAGVPNGYLAMDRFPGTGLVTTHSLNSIITDSAPGMACYATGNHSNNGQEGVYPANVISPLYYPALNTWPSTCIGAEAARSGWSPPPISKMQLPPQTRCTPAIATPERAYAISISMRAMPKGAAGTEPG